MVRLAVGDRLRFICQFYHQGDSYTGAKLHVAIGKGGTFGFNEKLNADSVALSFPVNVNRKLYQQTVDVPITSAISEGTDYEAYVKLMSIPGPDLFWYGPINDIKIETSVGVAQFTNLTVTYSKV